MIYNLEEKLDGQIPITRDELIDMDDYLSNFDVQTINNKDN